MLRSETHQQNREELPCHSFILINDKTSHYIYIKQRLTSQTETLWAYTLIHIQGVKQRFSTDGLHLQVCTLGL